MHRLAGLYAQGFNERWVRKGHLYEERFSCWVIRDDDHFHNAVEYILNNPVRADLCKHRQDWRWSFPRFELPERPGRTWRYEPCPGDCPPDTAGVDAAVRTTWTSPGPWTPTTRCCSMSALRLGPVTIASALGRSSPTAANS